MRTEMPTATCAIDAVEIVIMNDVRTNATNNPRVTNPRVSRVRVNQFRFIEFSFGLDSFAEIKAALQEHIRTASRPLSQLPDS